MTTFLKIIKKYKLELYLKDLLENSTSNNLPYHNFFHTMCVMRNCFLIAQDLELKYNEIRILLVSAIFHDFNHSGGKLKDKQNVENAIKAYLKVSEENEKFNDEVVDIISATEYPYVIDENKLTIYQKIIRDADLMQTFETNYLQQNWIGLSSEMNSDLLKSLEMSEKFWKGVKFHTEYAKKLSEKLMPARFEDVKYLLDILKQV